MPHVSKHPLKSRVREKITKQLVKFIVRSSRGTAVLDELLTDTETIMLAKRLAAIFMILKDFSYYRISRTLKISTSTVKRLHQSVLTHEYPTFEKIIGNKKEQDQFWKTVEMLLRAGMPPRGKGRWRRVYEIMDRAPH
jgi:uncharacterized protein YerC